MTARSGIVTILSLLLIVIFTACNRSGQVKQTTKDQINTNVDNKFGGFSNQVEWGEHLVTISGCGDCHTPKKMTPEGPVPDTSLLLSGHPSDVPAPDFNREEIESKGFVVTNDLTTWIGPWGISFAANLTPDETGIGSWSEEQFIRSIREGKFKGLENSRQLLPPMPWQELGRMSDGELKAVFAYLKSIKPIHNVVPPPLPPVSLKAN